MTVTGLPALIIMMIIALLWVYPMWRLLPKFGLSKWLACIGFIPVIGGLSALILIWIMAFRDPVSHMPSSEVFS